MESLRDIRQGDFIWFKFQMFDEGSIVSMVMTISGQRGDGGHRIWRFQNPALDDKFFLGTFPITAEQSLTSLKILSYQIALLISQLFHCHGIKSLEEMNDGVLLEKRGTALWKFPITLSYRVV